MLRTDPSGKTSLLIRRVERFSSETAFSNEVSSTAWSESASRPTRDNCSAYSINYSVCLRPSVLCYSARVPWCSGGGGGLSEFLVRLSRHTSRDSPGGLLLSQKHSVFTCQCWAYRF